MPQQTNYINSLTPLRGIAALMVAVLHFSDEWLPNLKIAEHTMLIQKGYLWVDFFFVLSGFIISHVYAGYFRGAFGFKTYAGFMFARFSKIYPIHLIVLFGFILMEVAKIGIASIGQIELFTQAFTGNKPPIGILTSVLMLHSMGVHDMPVWNLPAWSMSVEWYTYVTFPLLAILFLKPGRFWVIFSLIVCVVLVFWFASFRGMLNVIEDFGYIRCLLEFSLGMVIFRIYEFEIFRSFLSYGVVFVAAFFCVLLIMHFDAFDAYVVPLFGIIILSAAWNKGRLEKSLNVRFLVFLGEISYSLYMSHFLLREFIGRSWRVLRGKNIWEEDLSVIESWALLLWQLILVVLVAWIFYCILEKPLQRKIRNARLGKKFSLRSQ